MYYYILLLLLLLCKILLPKVFLDGAAAETYIVFNVYTSNVIGPQRVPRTLPIPDTGVEFIDQDLGPHKPTPRNYTK